MIVYDLSDSENEPPSQQSQTSDDDFIHDDESSLGSRKRNISRSESISERNKAAKKDKRMREEQATGLYKYQELSLVMEEGLRQSTLGGEIAANILFSSENKSFGMFSIKSTVPGLCRWTYRDFMSGGNGTIGEENVVTLPLVMIVYPPQQFLDLIMADNSDDEFPTLTSAIEKLRENLFQHEMCPVDVKIVFLMVNIFDECLLYQRRVRKESTDNGVLVSRRLDEAIAYLLYDQNIDMSCRENSAKLSAYLEATTRALGDQIYNKWKKGTDTLRRLPTRPVDAEEGLTSRQLNAIELEDTWARMLQTIPGISKARAANIIRQYSTPQSLMDALNDSSVPESSREALLQNVIDPSKNRLKLSKLIFKIFTATDPTQRVGEEDP